MAIEPQKVALEEQSEQLLRLLRPLQQLQLDLHTAVGREGQQPGLPPPLRGHTFRRQLCRQNQAEPRQTLPTEGLTHIRTGLVDLCLGDQVVAQQKAYFKENHPLGHHPPCDAPRQQMLDAAAVDGFPFDPT